MRKSSVVLLAVGAVVVVGGVFALRPLRALRQRAAAETGPATAQVITLDSTQVVDSSGAVLPEQQASLMWKTTGTVATVDVRPGDVVTAGQVLMTLDPASAPANVLQAHSDLLTAQKTLDDLQHPSALSLARAEQAVVTAQAQLDDAQRALDSLTQPDLSYYADQVAKKQAALLQAQQNAEKTDLGDLATALERAKATLDTKTNQLNDARSAQEQCPGCTVVFVNATGRRMSVADAEKEFNDAQDAYRVAELNYTQAQTNSGDAVTNAQSALDDAQANLAAAKTSPDAQKLAERQVAVTVAQATLADAQAALDRLQAAPDPADLAAAQARIQVAQAALNSLAVQAPFSGQVLAVNYHPGDPVAQATAAVVLANRDQLHVDVSVDESDVGRISAGDPVSVTVDALPDLGLTGTVASIQSFGETTQGLVRYTVRVDLAATDPRLLLNMTANASIVTAVQKDALAVPLEAVQYDDTGEYVLRLKADGTPERVEVTSGQAEGDWVVVTGPLQPGDVVQLVPAQSEQPATGFRFGRTP